MESAKELTLEILFTDFVKNPFTYNLNLGDQIQEKTIKCLFEKIKEIFLTGLIFTTDNKVLYTPDGKKSVLLDKISEKEILKIKEYMLSIGIEVVYKIYTEEDKDYHIRRLLYAVENIKDIKISTTNDWKTQYISNVSINVKPQQHKELMKIIKKFPESNYFLNMYEPEDISDFRIQYMKKEDPTTVHVIRFKEAKMTDYHYNHHFYDQLDKHVR
jgi:hypothetical protein